ncbi:MAG: S8 family serine peptidase [Proteobacteria bacterium]|nr:S8 family serine peptidase [Pseudomonadota bacterium]
MLWLRCLYLATLVGLLGGCAASPSVEEIPLRARLLSVTADGATPSLRKTLAEAGESRHALILMHQNPTKRDVAALRDAGIDLLYHLRPDLWVATVAADADFNGAAADRLLRWAGEIQPEDRLSPALSPGQIPDWAVEDEGRLIVAVETYPDVIREDAKALLARNGTLLASWDELPAWTLRTSRAGLTALTRSDLVKNIEPGPPPFLPLLLFARSDVGADTLQEIDQSGPEVRYNGLSGAGVQVGIWDDGIDRNHPDLAPRLLHNEFNGGIHGTRVAGIIGGSGGRSEACMGTPYGWRGIAPEAGLLSYTGAAFRPQPEHYREAIARGIDASNHSYLMSMNGLYDLMARRVDSLVAARRLTGALGPRTGRPMIWAAGNNGTRSQYSQVEGYFSVEAPAKNAITVGALYSSIQPSTEPLVSSSSLGPTLDGRLKPELVAPGGLITTTQLGSECYTPNGVAGTSFSAPVVTGAVALVLQAYAETFGFDLDRLPPLPALIKAVLVHTAVDMVRAPDRPYSPPFPNPDTGAFTDYHAGPDWATGYGALDAAASATLIRSRLVQVGRIDERSDIREYRLNVPEGLPRLKVTLAWDDPPFEGTEGPQTDPRLVNDLELRLVGPDARIHLPLVLPPLSPATQIGQPDPIGPDDIRPAAPGEDHVNNLEQVVVDGPSSGEWMVRVFVDAQSPGLLVNGQSFGLASDLPLDP